MVGWSIRPRDGLGVPAREVEDRVLRSVAPGDVVLLHDVPAPLGDGGVAAADALPGILAGLAQRGLEAQPVSEVLGLDPVLPADWRPQSARARRTRQEWVVGPVLLALVVALFVAGPWMISVVVTFSERLFMEIPGMLG